MTYLIQQRRKSSNLSWAAELPSKGHLWATPGPYLRKTLLLSLARKVSDVYLPETFYKEKTFPDLSYAKNRPEDEADFTKSLADKMVLHSENALGNEEESNSDSDSDDE